MLDASFDSVAALGAWPPSQPRTQTMHVFADGGFAGCYDCWTETSSHAELSAQIRGLGPEDEPDLVELFLTLDIPARVARFATASEAMLIQHAQRAISSPAFIAGAYVGGKLRGSIEVCDSTCASCCEAALVIAQAWRRRGLGAQLLQAATNWGKESGRRSLRMFFSAENLPMLRLASKAGAQLQLGPDEILAEIKI
jgi:GNAT superfamily N-acetyltransferase